MSSPDFPWTPIHSSRVLPPKRRRTGAPGEKEGPQAELLPSPLLQSDLFLSWCCFIYLFDKVPLRQQLIINVERGQRALCHFSRKCPEEGKDPSSSLQTFISHRLSHQSIDLVWAFRCCCCCVCASLLCFYKPMVNMLMWGLRNRPLDTKTMAGRALF